MKKMETLEPIRKTKLIKPIIYNKPLTIDNHDELKLLNICGEIN